MDSDQGRILAGILDAAENAPPVDALDAVTRELAAVLNARTVSFLIADLSGRALVRLAHAPLDGAGGTRHQGDEAATLLPFDGGPAEQALRTQTVQTLAHRGTRPPRPAYRGVLAAQRRARGAAARARRHGP